jgi:hypothetical protein
MPQCSDGSGLRNVDFYSGSFLAQQFCFESFNFYSLEDVDLGTEWSGRSIAAGNTAAVAFYRGCVVLLVPPSKRVGYHYVVRTLIIDGNACQWVSIIVLDCLCFAASGQRIEPNLSGAAAYCPRSNSNASQMMSTNTFSTLYSKHP